MKVKLSVLGLIVDPFFHFYARCLLARARSTGKKLSSRDQRQTDRAINPHALDSASAAGLGRARQAPRRASSQLITSQCKPATTAISQYS